MSWEGEEEEEEEEGVSEPGAGRKAESEFPGPQLPPFSTPTLSAHHAHYSPLPSAASAASRLFWNSSASAGL